MTLDGENRTALEVFMRKGPENREKVIRLLMETCVFIDIVELQSPGGHEKLAALVDDADKSPEWGTIFLRFMYGRRRTKK